MWDLSFRAVWVVSADSDSKCTVALSRRFPTVEKVWRAWAEQTTASVASLPFDADLATTFAEHLKRIDEDPFEGAVRSELSEPGSDSWADNPVVRHVISLRVADAVGPSTATGGERAGGARHTDGTPAGAVADAWGQSTATGGERVGGPSTAEGRERVGTARQTDGTPGGAQDKRTCEGRQEVLEPGSQAGGLKGSILWPIVAHRCSVGAPSSAKAPRLYILLLPLVHPRHAAAYERLFRVSDCGFGDHEQGEQHTLPQLLYSLPVITCAMELAQCMGAVIARKPDPAASSRPSSYSAQSAGTPVAASKGLFDSITSTMARGPWGLTTQTQAPSSSRPAESTPSPYQGGDSSGLGFLRTKLPGPAVDGALLPDDLLTATDKQCLRELLSTFLPFGSLVDFPSPSLVSALLSQSSHQDLVVLLGQKTSTPSKGYTGAGTPSAARKIAPGAGSDPLHPQQPAWKPLLLPSGAKQRVSVTLVETVEAALYDRGDEIPDSVTVCGKVVCRFDLEGLPDATLSLELPPCVPPSSLSFHPCIQASDLPPAAPRSPPRQPIPMRQRLFFCPPLGSFDALHYQLSSSAPPVHRLPVSGFFQLHLVTARSAQFLIKLRIMDQFGPPCHMEQCSLGIPTAHRILRVEGQPTLGTASISDFCLSWQVFARGYSGAPLDVSFAGELHFDISVLASPHQPPMAEPRHTLSAPAAPEVTWEDPFCWQSYSYARVSFKLEGGSVSGIAVKSEDISIAPAPSKAPPINVEHKVISKEYILWNTSGEVPVAAAHHARQP